MSLNFIIYDLDYFQFRIVEKDSCTSDTMSLKVLEQHLISDKRKSWPNYEVEICRAHHTEYTTKALLRCAKDSSSCFRCIPVTAHVWHEKLVHQNLGRSTPVQSPSSVLWPPSPPSPLHQQFRTAGRKGQWLSALQINIWLMTIVLFSSS